LRAERRCSSGRASAGSDVGRALAAVVRMTARAELKHFDRDDLRYLMECRDCGLFQRVLPAREGEVVACRVCHAVLRRTQSNVATLVCALAAAVLFAFAFDSPLMTLRAGGRVSSGTIYSGPDALARFGAASVGCLVLATLIVAPALKIGVVLCALLGERSSAPPRWLPWLYGWLERLGPWAMVDVFMLGAFVAYTRLRAIASTEIEPALFALAGVMLTMVAVDATIDRQAIWDSFDQHGLDTLPSRLEGELIGCVVCGRVSRTSDGTRCPRCRHRLRRRKPNSVSRSWALVVASALLYIPANTLAVMKVTRFGQGVPHTILGGVVELFKDHLWPLAVIVLLASAVVPIVKLVALSLMLVSTRRRARSHLLFLTRLFRVVSVVGRWSMIDIFALSTLVALVRLGFLATVFPGEGAAAFAGVVMLTMLATDGFDPRLMWDAARASSPTPRHVPMAVHSSRPTS